MVMAAESTGVVALVGHEFRWAPDRALVARALADGVVGEPRLATLDTVDPEPLPAGHWMYDHPKVRLSAHVSWYEPQIQRVALDIFIDNLGRFVRGEPLREVVDPAEGY